jgi:hypothetical protein
MSLQDRPVLDMSIDKDDFFKKTVPAIIEAISGDEKPVWGMMTVQHMVEHLIFPLQFVNSEMNVQVLVPAEKLPKQRAFLMSEYGMPQNFKMPLLPSDSLPKLMGESLQDSKKMLMEALDKFFTILDNPSFTTLPHPLFGDLNRDEWLTFQYKHFYHHFTQFDLV